MISLINIAVGNFPFRRFSSKATTATTPLNHIDCDLKAYSEIVICCFCRCAVIYIFRFSRCRIDFFRGTLVPQVDINGRRQHTSFEGGGKHETSTRKIKRDCSLTAVNVSSYQVNMLPNCRSQYFIPSATKLVPLIIIKYIYELSRSYSYVINQTNLHMSSECHET